MTPTAYSLLGLSVEFLGLTILFIDLFRSKKLGAKIEVFRGLQDQIDQRAQDLIVTANRAVLTLGQAVRHYFVLKERASNPDREIGPADRGKADEGLAEQLAVVTPQNLAELTEKVLSQALKSLKSPKEIDDAAVKIASYRLQIDAKFIDLMKSSNKLMWIAIIGVALVAVGGAIQVYALTQTL